MLGSAQLDGRLWGIRRRARRLGLRGWRWRGRASTEQQQHDDHHAWPRTFDLYFLCGFAQNFEQLFILRGLHGLGFGGERLIPYANNPRLQARPTSTKSLPPSSNG